MKNKIHHIIFIVFFSLYNLGCCVSVSAQCTFANPVSGQAPDPWVLQKDGFYYFCRTTGGGVTLFKSDKLETVAQGPGVDVWLAPGNSPFPWNIWAPELHYINNTWYIYVCGNRNNSFNGHETFVLEGTTQNPMDPYTYKGRLENGIDGSVIQMKDGSLYFTWSYYNPDQRIYMSRMINPWTLSQPYVELSKPEFAWETSGAGINEGPEFISSGNTLMVVYSASGSWTKDYCLGLVYCNGGDPMNKANWTKVSSPVFQSSVTNSIYGPGHCSFTKSPDGLENWIAFHAKNSNIGGWDNRTLHLQPFTFMANNLPDFGVPKSEGAQILCPTQKPALVNGHTYFIQAKNSGKVCGIVNNGTNNTDKVVQQSATDNASQKWVAFDLTNGYWKFINVRSVRSMEIENTSLVDGGASEQFTFSNSDWQQWKVEPATTGFFKITNKGSGKVLDVNGGPSAIQEGVKIQQWTWLSGDNQQWSLREVQPASEGKSYIITAKHSQKAVQVYKSGTMNGDKIGQFTINGLPAQRWTAHQTAGNLCHFDNVNSGKTLEVGGLSNNLGGAIQQWGYAGINWQQWSMIGTDEGFYKFINYGSGMAMDVNGGTTAVMDGDSIHQWNYLGADNQKWKLTESVDILTKVEEVKNEVVSIFPNPANESINISSTGIIYTVNIVDIQGRILYSNNEIFNGMKVIPLQGLSTGLYFIQIKSEDKQLTEKLIIK
jgi:GH43 family beta-xylosidase